jgi:hypothetical protein
MGGVKLAEGSGRFGDFENPCQNRRQIGQDLFVLETHNSVAERREFLFAGVVMEDVLFVLVDAAIHLNDQFARGTVEIEDEPPCRMLPTPAKAAELPALESIPEHLFSRRRSPSQLTSSLLDLLP